MLKRMAFCLLATISLFGEVSYGQSVDAATSKLTGFPSRFLGKVQSQAADLDSRLTRQTEKYLKKLARQEDRLRKKMFAQDSVAAARVFGKSPLDYQALLTELHNIGTMPSLPGPSFPGGTVYVPYLDSIKTSLKFLQQQPGILPAGEAGNIAPSLTQVSQLQQRIQVTEAIRQAINRHKQELQQALSQYSHLPAGLQSTYQAYSQEAYYYSAQLHSYTDELSNPDKVTKRALTVLNQRADFSSFIKTHSELASLFSLPGGSGGLGGGMAQPIPGLQTRAVVQQQLQGKLEASGPDGQAMVQQKIQSAKTALKSWQDKALKAGGSSSAMAIPDFRPNSQRTKTLWRRLQYGLDLQSLPSTYAFPVTSDIGASLAYKLNDKSLIGIGASYKIGWGKDIQHINITSQGTGLRSFFETKIKGSFSAYGGYEYNYQEIIYSLRQISNLNYWTQSGLIGVTKQYHISNKVKGELQLLLDFLSYRQVPKTQPVLFRIGYLL